jgi:drug/metabolite transporter (DMT)-like permease
VRLSTTVIGRLVLGQPIRGFHWLGAALILPGIYLATRPHRNG